MSDACGIFHNNHAAKANLKHALLEFSKVFLDRQIEMHLFDWVNLLDAPTRGFNVRYVDDITSLEPQLVFDTSYPTGSDGTCMRNANAGHGMTWNSKGDCHANADILGSFVDGGSRHKNL